MPAEAATNSGAARCSRKGADHVTAQPTGGDGCRRTARADRGTAGSEGGPEGGGEGAQVVAACEMPEAARKAAASKILVMRATGIEVMHKQAYMMATLVQELRNEEQFMADFAHGVV